MIVRPIAAPGRRIAVIAVATFVGACGDTTAPRAEPGPPGLHILAGAAGRDTAGAWLPEPLTVVVRDADGLPVVGETVRFSSIWHDFKTPSALVAASPGGPTPDVLTTKTDRTGTARAAIALGSRAGDAWVRVSVPISGEELTATYRVDPGGAYAILAPAETWIVPDQRYAPDVAVIDRHENRRDDRPALTSVWSGLVVDGSDVVGRSVGRGDLTAHWQDMSATFSVTVGPPGRIAGVAPSGIFDGTGPGDPAVYALTLGKDDLREVTSGPGVGWPDWSPVDSTLVFVSGPTPWLTDLQVVARAGEIRRLEHPDVGLTAEAHPHFGVGGEWIYFTGVPDHQNGEIWRLPASGGVAQRIGPKADWYDYDGFPSPSPDGSRVVFRTNRFTERLQMAVLDVETGEITALSREGVRPRWSPNGEWIAYIRADAIGDGEIRLTRPDGSEDHTVSAPGRRYGTGVAWSPNGDWLVAYADDTRALEFVEIATGLTLIHPTASDFTHPSWGR